MGQLLHRGVLVAFEGIDGAGKTTQAELLAQRLSTDGFTVTKSKEPTSGPWGERIRRSAETGRMSAEDELAAFLEDRREHVRDLIQPALQAGHVVIVDRYYFSTVAYQGARGMSPDHLLAINEAFAPQPDLLVLLDVPPRVGVERIRTRGDIANLFEREADLEQSAAIFRSIQRPYLALVDGTRPIATVSSDIQYRLYEGPIRDRLLAPEACPNELSDAARNALFAEVNRIRADSSIPDENKAEAILSILDKLS